MSDEHNHATESDRVRREMLEERRSRQLREQFVEAVAQAERRAERLGWTVGELEAELRRRADEMDAMTAERSLQAERARDQEQALIQRLAAVETDAASLAAEADRLAKQLHQIRASRSWRMAELLSGLKNSKGRPRALRHTLALWRLGPGSPQPRFAATPEAPILPPGPEVPAPEWGATVSIVLDVQHWDRTWSDVVAGIERQTMANLEIVLSDGGLVPDERESALRSLSSLSKVVVVRVSDASSDTRRFCTGRYHCELTQPVRLHPTFFEKAVALLDGHPEVGFAYSWSRTTEGDLWRVRDGLDDRADPGHRPICVVARRENCPTPFVGRVITEPLAEELAPRGSATETPRRSQGAASSAARRPVPAGGLKPVVLTLPWFTLGGADRVVEALLRHWRERDRTVVAVTTVDLGAGMADRFGELLDLTPFAYHLPRLLPLEQWPGFVGGLLESLPEPTLLNVGSPWVYGVLAEMKERFPQLRVVDQQFNDIGHLPGNRLARESIDVTIAAYTELAETIRSDERQGAVEVVPVGIPSIHPADERDVKALRQSLGLPDDHRVVSFVGRLSREKRPEWALALSADLTDDDISVLLVGDGPLAEVLHDGIEAVPTLVWLRSVERIEPLLALTDVMVIPSRIEGIPLVAMEALTVGLPVVATRVGGLSELESDPLMRLCDSDDYPGFVETVREALASEQADREYRPEMFSLQTMLERYDRLIDATG